MARIIVITTEGQADSFRSKLRGQDVVATDTLTKVEQLLRENLFDIILWDPRHLLPHPLIPLVNKPRQLVVNRHFGTVSHVSHENWRQTLQLLAASGVFRQKRRSWACCE